MSLANWIIKLLEEGLEQYQPDLARAVNQLPGDMVAPPSGGSRGTVALSDDDPEPIGTAAPGSSGEASRADHVHELTFTNQSANTVFAGPATGGAAAPGFRALVAADLPAEAVRRASSATAGRVAFWSGANEISHDADLTYDAATNILTIGDGLNIGTSAPIVSVSTRRYIAIRGSSDAGVFEGSTGAADAANNQVVQLIGADRHSIAADKRLGGMTVATEGTTATNRGARLEFYTKADGASGINLRMRITQAGDVGIGIDPAATLDVVRGTASHGTAKFQGTTYHSHFSYSTAENTYIRGGKATSGVVIGDSNTGGVYIGASGNKTTIGGGSTATRNLSLDVGGSVHLSFNNAGVEKWVLGCETTVSDRFIIYSGGLATYALIIDKATEKATFNGTVDTNSQYQVDGTRVVTNRQPNWVLPSGTLSRSTFDTGTVTLAVLAQKVGALILDLHTHGLIGP